jgi:hypothetical protein
VLKSWGEDKVGFSRECRFWVSDLGYCYICIVYCVFEVHSALFCRLWFGYDMLQEKDIKIYFILFFGFGRFPYRRKGF